MGINVGRFPGHRHEQGPQEPPASEKRDLKPSHVRCPYCKSWADFDAVKKQKYKCLNCGGPLEMPAPTERAEAVQDDGDFGAMMRRRLEESKRRLRE